MRPITRHTWMSTLFVFFDSDVLCDRQGIYNLENANQGKASRKHWGEYLLMYRKHWFGYLGEILGHGEEREREGEAPKFGIR